MPTPSARPLLPAALFALLAALAAPARAEQVTTNLKGKVSAIYPIGNPLLVSQFGALGVHLGTSANCTLVIEASTPGQPGVGEPWEFQQYALAITGLSVSAAGWQTALDGPAATAQNDFVQVADNAASDGGAFDSWSGTAPGLDPGGLVGAYQSGEDGTFHLQFTSTPPGASGDAALVQDFGAYKTTRSLSFGGAGGLLVITLDKPAKGVDPTALGRAGQLEAAGKAARKVLKGLGHIAAAAPDGTEVLQEIELLETAGDAFVTQCTAAILASQKKGGDPPLDQTDLLEAKDALLLGLQVQAESITIGADTQDPADRALRGKLLRALGKMHRADFHAWALDAKHPDAGKLAAALLKSHAKLAESVGKALEKAAQQSVVYAGPDAAALTTAATELIDAFVGITETGL